MPRPTCTARARGDSLRQGLHAIRLLREAPYRPGELAREVGVSLATAKRILSAIRAAGLPLAVRREGRGAWYSLPPETLARVMP